MRSAKEGGASQRPHDRERRDVHELVVARCRMRGADRPAPVFLRVADHCGSALHAADSICAALVRISPSTDVVGQGGRRQDRSGRRRRIRRFGALRRSSTARRMRHDKMRPNPIALMRDRLDMPLKATISASTPTSSRSSRASAAEFGCRLHPPDIPRVRVSALSPFHAEFRRPKSASGERRPNSSTRARSPSRGAARSARNIVARLAPRRQRVEG